MWEQRILDARSAQLGLRARAGGARVGRGRSGPSGPPYLLSWQMKGALTEIIQLATLDSDPWVLMVADILKSFPDTGSLNLDLEEQNPNVQDILGELREKGRCGPTVPEGQTASLQTPLLNELASRVSVCCAVCGGSAGYLCTPPPHPRPRAAVQLFAHLRDKAPSSLHLFFSEICYFHVHESPCSAHKGTQCACSSRT